MISGGIKFFKKPRSYYADGTSGVATSGQSSVEHMLTSNEETFYRSVGSDDTTTETIEITLPATQTIDRVYVRDINWKEFSIKYKTSGVWTDFTNVISIKNSTPASSISVNNWDQDTIYFEFDSVSTSEIQLNILKTQTANEEKYANWFFVTLEYGTLVGFPLVGKINQDRNIKMKKTLSGKYSTQLSTESIDFNINFKTYPVSDSVYHADLDLVMFLNDLNEGFLVWLCGGKYGTSNFKYTLRGFRLRDARLMKLKSKINTSYLDSIYINPVSLDIDLVESIN